jgi:hypothetical protein
MVETRVFLPDVCFGRTQARSCSCHPLPADSLRIGWRQSSIEVRVCLTKQPHHSRFLIPQQRSSQGYETVHQLAALLRGCATVFLEAHNPLPILLSFFRGSRQVRHARQARMQVAVGDAVELCVGLRSGLGSPTFPKYRTPT